MEKAEQRAPSWIFATAWSWTAWGAGLTAISAVILFLAGAGVYTLVSLTFLAGGAFLSILCVLFEGLDQACYRLFYRGEAAKEPQPAPKPWTHREEAKPEDNLPKRAPEWIERYIGARVADHYPVYNIENSRGWNRDLAVENLDTLERIANGEKVEGVHERLDWRTPEIFCEEFLGVQLQYSGGDGEYWIWHRGGVKPPSLDYIYPGRHAENRAIIREALAKQPDWLVKKPN